MILNELDKNGELHVTDIHQGILEKSFPKLSQTNTNLFNFLNLNKNFVAQPLVKGVSYSANVIPIKNKAFILNFNKQEISYKKKKIVFKGTKFIKKVPFETKIKKNIKNIYTNLVGLNSFFGIDFIISNKKIFFLDINPRITTSYKNINKNLKINAAKKILNTL